MVRLGGEFPVLLQQKQTSVRYQCGILGPRWVSAPGREVFFVLFTQWALAGALGMTDFATHPPVT